MKHINKFCCFVNEKKSTNLVDLIKKHFEDVEEIKVEGNDSKFKVEKTGDIEVDTDQLPSYADIERPILAWSTVECVLSGDKYKVTYSGGANHKEVPDWEFSLDPQTEMLKQEELIDAIQDFFDDRDGSPEEHDDFISHFDNEGDSDSSDDDY